MYTHNRAHVSVRLYTPFRAFDNNMLTYFHVVYRQIFSTLLEFSENKCIQPWHENNPLLSHLKSSFPVAI